MAQPIQTHINAYYADLVIAKQEQAAVNQKVTELEEAILARGGELPDEQPPELPAEEQEDTASSDDESASESKSISKKGKK